MTDRAIAYVTPSTLTHRVDFDSAFTIREGDDSHIYDAPGVYAPTVYDDAIDSDQWEFFSNGYTGQYGYNGPMMHNSEILSGRLASDILDTPGTYAVVAGTYSCEEWEECAGADYCDGEHWEGWAVVRLAD